MFRSPRLTQILSASTLWLIACAAPGDDGAQAIEDRAEALEALQQQAGAPVKLETNELGVTRVVSMTPQFSVSGHATDPAEAALNFLKSRHDLFQIDAADAASFVVTNVDAEPSRNMTHVTLQRVVDGIPVFAGAITVHMDNGNGVFRVLGNDAYRASAPTNRMMLSPSDAAVAAGRAMGLALSPGLGVAEGQITRFDVAGTLDPVRVEPQIFQVSSGDDRFAYQVQVSWLDEQKQQQYQLALIDAQDGSLLANHSLVNTFTGRVFNVNAQATANMTTDTRSLVSFDGDPAASPIGWVGSGRNTVGNNVAAATDLNADNVVGTNEVRPTANASDSFDFPFDPLQNASLFRSASVANLFFLINDFHDRTYRLGFTESARNFQTNNFGLGGAQNDPVNGDAQDGSGTNNANFATPTDGSRPRMQMFIFTITGGATEDSDFDETVVYHEYAHGLSNRLVGGGLGTCLRGIQSGGMGEGWGDFMAATFLNHPVVGAYVTGNTVRGIRSAPMDNSPFTFNDIRNGTLSEVHDVGELWAATLWDARDGVDGVGGVGAATIEQLVVSGMKLTPCNPSMLNARDGIIQADININGAGNPNQCKLWAAFANRLMGTGASSATHNSTTTVVTSTAVPPECEDGGGGGGNVVFSDDFEIDRGWTANPNGTDTAPTGRFERANPETTSSNGTTTQLGTTPSGSFDLVTGGLAGASAGANDVDSGVTTIQSPPIAIPATGTTTLAIKSYLAHLNNATADDFLRVQIVGGLGTGTAIDRRGAATTVAASFVSQTFNISAFAGDTVRIVVSAADNGTASLIEAAVDDIVITNQ
jgi:hypothetical protein